MRGYQNVLGPKRQFIYIYIYIYIYIVIHRQIVSFYQNSSVWLDTQDALFFFFFFFFLKHLLNHFLKVKLNFRNKCVELKDEYIEYLCFFCFFLQVIPFLVGLGNFLSIYICFINSTLQFLSNFEQFILRWELNFS